MMKKVHILLFAVLLLGAPLTAQAQEGTPASPAAPAHQLTGKELMALGEESYGIGDYDKALVNFKDALPLLTDAPDKAKAHERLGYIYAAFGQMDNVYNEFVEALKLDPGIMMDPNQASPKIYEAYKKARDIVVHEGTLAVNCDPAGAAVFLDGKPIGESPVKMEHITEGEYTLTLKKPGYETSTGKITIKKDVTLTVEDKLVEARGEVTINTEPSGAAITFDGRDEGFTPLTVKKVSGGSHSIIVKRDYYDDYESAVTIEKGEKKSLGMSLKRRVLLLGMVDGEGPGLALSPVLDALVSGPFKEMGDVRVIGRGMKSLEKDILERGLDPASLKFLKTDKVRLDLEDSAVFSGIMENAGAELALVLHLVQGEKEKALTVILYSVASDMGDKVILKSGDMDGLEKEFEGFLLKWEDQGRPGIPTIGARLIDRADGGAEVISVLPGLPAAVAGVIPGDVIDAAGPAEIRQKKDLVSLLKPGEKLEIKFNRKGKRQSVTVVPALAPKETPVDETGYLYNVALADSRAQAEEVSETETPRKPDGQSALNLGNVYFHLGDYEKAVKAYKDADTGTNAGVCTGTALYRLGMAYERLGRWVDAAGSYRKALMLYPDATLGSAEGPYVAPLAKERLKELFRLGLVKERWWL